MNRFAIFILIFPIFLFAKAQEMPNLFPAEYGKNGKCGYIDSTGKIVIDYIFESAADFSDGLARVSLNGKYGFIDKKGKFVIEPQFESASDFEDGAATFHRGNKILSVNKKAKVAEVQGRDDYRFRNDVVRIEMSGKYGFVDFDGKIIVPAEYDEAGDFKAEPAWARKGKTYYFFDRKGKLKFHTNMTPIGHFSENMLQVRSGKKYGYINPKGELVIDTVFDYLTNEPNEFRNGRAMFQTGNWYKHMTGFIDKTGKTLLQTDYQYVENFVNGYAQVLDSVWGVMDKSGKIIVPFRYEKISDFSEGYFVCVRNKGDYTYEYEIVDKTGAILHTFEAYEGFRNNTGFVHGICRLYQTVHPDEKFSDPNIRQWGGVRTIYVNTKGQIVWESEPWYSCFPPDARVLKDDYSEVKIKNIRPGERIKSYNTQTKKLETSIVLDVEEYENTYELVEISYSDIFSLTASNQSYFSSGTKSLKVTLNHPIATETGVKIAKEIEAGERLLIFNQLSGEPEYLPVIYVEREMRKTKVYNLHTSKSNYFVDDVMVYMK